MDEKALFIADVLRGVLTITDICQRYNISRNSGYKLIRRYRLDGPPALQERSRRPLSCPHRTQANIERSIIELRRRHPRYGAKKLLQMLQEREPHVVWPARSTVCDILSRNDLVTHPRRRHHPGHPGRPKHEADEPNDLWATDFKGQFKTSNGIYCYPLTVTDIYSRMLLECHGLHSTAGEGVKPVFRRLFQEFGLPRRIRSDNGSPFATVTLGRLSMLSAWWIRLGILPELIQPASPQQNGKHERMHRTLKDFTARPPAATMRSQQRRFDDFKEEFNHVRPHEALGQKRPASLYKPSPRPYPSKLPKLEYPAHFETRYVSADGGFRWKHHRVGVSSCCIGEYVGLEEVDEGAWDVYFGALRLGRFLEEHYRIQDQYGKLMRHSRYP